MIIFKVYIEYFLFPWAVACLFGKWSKKSPLRTNGEMLTRQMLIQAILTNKLMKCCDQVVSYSTAVHCTGRKSPEIQEIIRNPP